NLQEMVVLRLLASLVSNDRELQQKSLLDPAIFNRILTKCWRLTARFDHTDLVTGQSGYSDDIHHQLYLELQITDFVCALSYYDATVYTLKIYQLARCLPLTDKKVH